MKFDPYINGIKGKTTGTNGSMGRQYRRELYLFFSLEIPAFPAIDAREPIFCTPTSS
jgi:hypothetical protein